jgi:hypothetical protein
MRITISGNEIDAVIIGLVHSSGLPEHITGKLPEDFWAKMAGVLEKLRRIKYYDMEECIIDISSPSDYYADFWNFGS